MNRNYSGIFLYTITFLAFIVLFSSSDTDLGDKTDEFYYFIEELREEWEWDENEYEFGDEKNYRDEEEKYTPPINLVEAVKKGNLKETIRFLKEDREVNTESDNGNPLIVLAAESNNTKLVEYLLKKGADPRAKTPYGWTALHAAVIKDNLKMTKLLVKYGADINAGSPSVHSPFYYAAVSGDIKMVNYFINLGIDVSDEKTAVEILTGTINFGNYRNFRYIAGLQPASFDWAEVFPAAIIVGNPNIIRYIVDYKGVNILNKIQWNHSEYFPIELAVKKSYRSKTEKNTVHIVKYFMEKGAVLSDINGGEIFPWAFENCEDYMVDFFYEQGFTYEPVCEVDKNGWTSLAISLDENNFVWARCFLQVCKDSTFRDKPLVVYFADGFSDSPKIISFLIKHGVNREHYSEAFLQSIKNDDYESAGYLINAGADINYTCPKGLNALYYARRKVVIKSLIEQGIDIYHPKTLENAWENFALLRVLDEMNIIPPVSLETANRGLHRAALMGDSWTVAYFLRRGAEPDSMLPPEETLFYNYNYELTGKSTAFIKNCIYGYRQNSPEKENQVSAETARVLINAGADLNLTDESGNTPLHYVAATSDKTFRYHPLPAGNRREMESGMHADPAPPFKQNHDLIAEVLINAGADIEVTDRNGNTPLLLAVAYRNKRTVELLLNAGAKINVWNKKGESPLSIARKWSLTEIETLLKSVSE